jgi:hypothetical protein
MALVALDVSALAAAPQLMADDVDRDMLRSALAAAALAGGGAGGSGSPLQAHLFDLRTPDLGGALSGVPKGEPPPPAAPPAPLPTRVRA